MRTVAVVGNPKPRSRTYESAQIVAERLTGSAPDDTLDVTDLGARLLDWSDQDVAAAMDVVRAADLVVVASPTYKATYTGLLKLFLDRFGADELTSTLGVALMLGGHWKHALAAELTLKPVLVEIGLSVPFRGLFLLDSQHAASETLDRWVELSTPLLGT